MQHLCVPLICVTLQGIADRFTGGQWYPDSAGAHDDGIGPCLGYCAAFAEEEGSLGASG